MRQNGNHIWIEPIERKKVTVLSEEIIVDGRKYEKGLVVKKGTLVADWGKDGTSLWLQVEVPGEDGGPPSGSQRAIWRLARRRNRLDASDAHGHEGRREGHVPRLSEERGARRIES